MSLQEYSLTGRLGLGVEQALEAPTLAQTPVGSKDEECIPVPVPGSVSAAEYFRLANGTRVRTGKTVFAVNLLDFHAMRLG